MTASTSTLSQHSMDGVCDHLTKLGVTHTILENGDLIFRRDDGVPMYVRAYPDDQYDWTFTGSHNDENHLDIRAPHKQSMEQLFAAIEQFRRGH